MKAIKSYYTLINNKIENINIVHFSDIHFSKKYNNKRLDLLINESRKINPDYICITGDLLDNNYVLDNNKSYKIMYDFLVNLSKICKVILTLGNHEQSGEDNFLERYNQIIKKLENIPNLVLLDNEIYIDKNIRFVGFNPSKKYYKKLNDLIFIEEFKNLKLKLDFRYNILLIHTPRKILENDIYLNGINKFDLVLAGHTHGGMMPVNIKGNNGIISPEKKLFPKNVRGHLKRNNTNLIICSGVVRLSNSTYWLQHLNFLYKIHFNHITLKLVSSKKI